MNYKIRISKHAFRAMQSLTEQNRRRIESAIDQLEIDPRPQGSIKLQGRDALRIRVGNFRIIYEVDDELRIVSIEDVGNRKDVYR